MSMKKIRRLINRYDAWQWIRIALAGAIVSSACVLVLELAVPLRCSDEAANLPVTNAITDGALSEIAQPAPAESRETGKSIRPGLFKAESPIRDKPMADKTLEKIKSQLKLLCIMRLNGEPVAYVDIKGEGMRQCRVGDSVNDLFTVLDIGDKSVAISIVGHRQILSL